MNKISNFYNKNENEEFIEWETHPEYEGFSVIRNYPNNLKFKPTITNENNQDSRILIKIGRKISSLKDDKFDLFVSASKYSVYLSNHFSYNFEDKNSPTKESINDSNNSQQPIDLTEDYGRFNINILDGNCFDNEKNKKISLNEIVEYIYKLHLDTISGVKASVLKSKMNLQRMIVSLFGKFKKSILWFLLNIFGKEMISTKENWLEGEVYLYKYKNIRTVYPQNIPFFNSDLQISKKAVLLSSLFIFCIWFILPISRSIEGVFQVAGAILFIYLIDKILPIVLLTFVNLNIWIINKIRKLKIKIK